MTPDEFLHELFPGDGPFPGFRDVISYGDIGLVGEKYAQLSSLLANKSVPEEDVNLVLKHLRKTDPKFLDWIQVKLLEGYFSHPEVIKLLNDDKETLFPNVRVLPDSDYDVLEPVLMLDDRVFTDGL